MAYTGPACVTHYGSSNPNPLPFPAKQPHSLYQHPHKQPLPKGRISSRNPSRSAMILGSHAKAKASSRKTVAASVNKQGSHTSSQSSIWSTPHAPRQRKPLAATLGSQAPVGSVGSVPSGARREGKAAMRHPSTHTLLKSHSYLDETTFAKRVTSTATKKVCCNEYTKKDTLIPLVFVSLCVGG